jgi:hypothetical protein
MVRHHAVGQQTQLRSHQRFPQHLLERVIVGIAEEQASPPYSAIQQMKDEPVTLVQSTFRHTGTSANGLPRVATPADLR